MNITWQRNWMNNHRIHPIELQFTHRWSKPKRNQIRRNISQKTAFKMCMALNAIMIQFHFNLSSPWRNAYIYIYEIIVSGFCSMVFDVTHFRLTAATLWPRYLVMWDCILSDNDGLWQQTEISLVIWQCLNMPGDQRGLVGNINKTAWKDASVMCKILIKSTSRNWMGNYTKTRKRLYFTVLKGNELCIGYLI